MSITELDIYSQSIGPTDAPTILMIHGLGGSHQGLLALARALSDWQVVLIDLPGHGRSAGFTGGYSIGLMANFINQYIEQMPTRPVAVFGHSFGSLLCLAGASLQPDLYQSMILCNPVHYNQQNRNLIMRMVYRATATVPQVIGKKIAYSRRVNRIVGDQLLTTQNQRLRDRLQKTGYDDKLRVDYRAGMELLADAITFDTARVLDALRLPTLAITGTSDHMIDDVTITALTQNPMVTIRQIPGGGHLLPAESPRRVARQIDSWLKQIL